MIDAGRLRQVLVYPDAFAVKQDRPDVAGVVHNNMQWREGESWQQGQVILSWRHTLAGATIADDGRNLVVHEFAHHFGWSDEDIATIDPWWE